MPEFAVFREIKLRACPGHLRAFKLQTPLMRVTLEAIGRRRKWLPLPDWIPLRQALMIEPDLRSIAPARHWAAKHLRAAGVDGYVLDVLILLVSEVVTNAISHALPPVSLHLLVTDTQARVEVYDRAYDKPMKLNPPPSAVGGRGVGLIDQLATDWGTVELHDGDPLKLVWFELDLAS